MRTILSSRYNFSPNVKQFLDEMSPEDRVRLMERFDKALKGLQVDPSTLMEAMIAKEKGDNQRALG